MSNASGAEGSALLLATRRKWQYAITAAILLVGITISIGVYFLLRSQEQERMVRDFDRASHDRMEAAKKTLGLDFLTLQSVQVFYDGSREVSRDGFRTFVNPFVKGHKSIQAIKWIPRVRDSKRSTFENLATKEGLAEFQISEFDHQGTWVRASGRSEYFPVFFAEPAGSNTTTLGHDLATIPDCRSAMDIARDTGQCVMTGKIIHPQKNSRTNVRVFLPVYQKKVPFNTVEERRHALDGYVVGILRPKWIVEEGLAGLMSAGVNVKLLDTTVPDQPQSLYAHLSRLGHEKTDNLRCVESFDVAGRQWSVVCTATPSFMVRHTTWYPLASAVGIFLLTGFLGLFFVKVTQRNVTIVKLADQLTDTNRQLEKASDDRKQVEATLYSSETKYKTLYDASADAIFLTSPEGKFIDGNHAATVIFGCKDKSEFISLTPTELSPEYQPDGSLSSEKLQLIVGLAMRDNFNRFEWLHKRIDGTEFLTMVTLSRMEVDEKQMLLATVRDITEQRCAEEAFRASERRLRLFAENVDDVLWTAEVSGQFTYFSPSVERMLGLKWKEGMRLTIADIMTSESLVVAQTALMNLVAQAKAGERIQTQQLELELRRTDGSTLCGEVTVNAMYDESGEVIGVLGVSRDATQRKRMENELRDAKETAEAATLSKSRFLANMSHEIRTPMTAILGYADLLMDPSIDARTRNSYAATIRRGGEHLLTLINDILDISKIEANKMTLDIAPCNLVSLLADIASVVRPRAEVNGVSFSIEYPDSIPETILTDGARLRQTIINLAGNAVKFTEKGSVRIVVSFVQKEKLCGDQPAISFQVIDTGIGIREAMLSQLFQPFHQGDASVAKKYGGTGLGLTISRHIALMLGGELTVTSVWEKGSNFTLTVPTGSLDGVRLLNYPSEVAQDTEVPAWNTTAENLQGVRILLAEDGPDNRRLIKAILTRAGAVVETAENGQLAIEQAKDRTFDLILMDMNMPVMDGYEATSLLRDQGYSKPIVALTANAMMEDRERCQLAGCDEYLTKPIDRVLLIQTIAQFVNATKNTAN